MFLFEPVTMFMCFAVVQVLELVWSEGLEYF